MISTPAPSVIVDTDILCPAGIRDILFRVAETDLYRLKWSPDIRRELISTIRKVRPDLDHAQFERHTLALMDQFFHDGLVTGYEHYIDDLEGIHVNDRHVVAAAIKSSCSVILTHNLKDFPAESLASHGIVAMKPNDFLMPILLAARRSSVKPRANTVSALRSLHTASKRI
ncbi:MAG: PIN domain-containing protein [Chloroflexi bacterium]|nr:PIN domain-containing protein [Chloroflexota bacterium]